MSNFRGYLIQFINSSNVTKNLSNKYISLKSYKTYPNQRLEIQAYRDANALLHRVTSPHYKTKIEFQTLGNLNLYQKEDLFSEINHGLVDRQKRTYKLRYWNDEEGNYKTSSTNFYMPDVEFTIKKITEYEDNSNIIYEPIRIAFIEY